MTPRDAFPGYDDPVNIDCEPEEALKVLMSNAPDETNNEEDDEAAEDEPDEDATE